MGRVPKAGRRPDRGHAEGVARPVDGGALIAGTVCQPREFSGVGGAGAGGAHSAIAGFEGGHGALSKEQFRLPSSWSTLLFNTSEKSTENQIFILWRLANAGLTARAASSRAWLGRAVRHALRQGPWSRANPARG